MENSRMDAGKSIECHTCGVGVILARSVMLRQWVGLHHNSPTIEFGYSSKPVGSIIVDPERPPGLAYRDDEARRIAGEQGIEGLGCPIMQRIEAKKRGPWTADEIAYMDQHAKLMKYRRAFVCCACFAAMDSGDCGGCVIARDGKARLFYLGGASRGDKAAIVTPKKYLQHQRRIANKAGFSCDAIQGAAE